ncbi:MAG: hypothetical protein ACREPS_00700 [Rhodanobacteraceae bacterium]
MSDHKDNQTPPTFEYWRVWVDDESVSRQTRQAITDFKHEGMGGAAPQWNAKLPAKPVQAMFSVLPVGWTGDWHENPEPQWIVPLSGRWFVETMDGHRVEMGTGEVSFGGDQNCKADAEGQKGHRSGVLGNEPVVLMIVQMEQSS